MSSPLTFNPDQASRTFTVPILDDAIYEGNETVHGYREYNRR